ncbi:MAG: FeoA family protein [Bacteroidales bacterium]|nr:ferrous iron transport protein A [Bacteroidales bacterium]MBS3777280.1 ferrous iron transport protein A [Bacteroidales bacterium]
MKKSLVKMKPGETGTITEIEGGIGVRHHLDSLGIRINKKVEKVSQVLMKGPVTIKVDNSKIAIGRGMASKIYVNADSKDAQ